MSVEAVHDRQRPWYILSQFSRQKAVLNLVVLVLSVASGIIAPLQVAFPAMFAGVEWRAGGTTSSSLTSFSSSSS